MKLIATVLATSLIAIGAAQAADPMMPAPYIEPVAEAFDWTGFYIGAIGGAATGDGVLNITGDFTEETTFDGELSNSMGGLFGGVQVGGDVQFNNFVLGAYADIAASDIDSELSLGLDINETDVLDASITSKLNYLGTLQGRLGIAHENLLGYVHGGLAWGNVERNVNFSLGGGPGDDIDLGNTDHVGYVVGAGVEYAVTDSISIKTEYSFYDLGDEDIDLGVLDPLVDDIGLDTSESLSFHAVQAGVSFRF